MCGIFGYIGKEKNAADIILNGLKSLEYRGYDSWGVAVKTGDGKLFIEKHPGKIGDAKLPPLSSSTGIGHTRWATHGGVTQENAHPHLDCSQKIVVVHNGIFENYLDFKNDLIKKGHTFLSQTDTEVIAHLLEEEHKTIPDTKALMLSVFAKMKGLSAVIAYFPDEEKIYAIKNSAPLIVACTTEASYLASDAAALRPFSDTVGFLEDNQLLCIDGGGCHVYDLDGKEISLSLVPFTYSIEQAELGNFADFTHKEIHEQPTVLHHIKTIKADEVKRIAQTIKSAYGTYFIGCGTAHYASLASAYIFSKIAKRHVNCWSASEFSYLLDFLKDTSLVVTFSQSGETIDVISSIKAAKEKHAKIMAITNVIGSTLYRSADHKIHIDAGPEKSVVSTKVFTAWVGLMYMIAYELTGQLEKGTAELEKAIAETKNVLANEDHIKKISVDLCQDKNIFIIGRGLSYVAALETALKIKEASYIHAEGLAGGDLKHGPIALIEKGTPVVIFNPEDETYDDTLSSTNEVKARGAKVIGISSKNNDLFDEFIEVKNCNDAGFIPNIVVGQLLGYHCARGKGLDPDKPRNLAKSVTVK